MDGGMKAGLLAAVVAFCALQGGSALAWDFTLSVSGNTIIVNVNGMDTSAGQTCAGGSVDIPGGGAFCSQPGLSYRTLTLDCNRIGTHVVYVDVFDATTGNTYQTKTGTIDVTTPPPPTCPVFQIGAQSAMVLTHKYGPETYPRGQTQDAQATLIFKPIQVDPAVTFYLKVVDPKDPSTYRTAAPATNDNIDSGAGRLAFSPSDSGSTTQSFTVGAANSTTFYLNITGFASGDNYEVWASADPNMLTDPNFVCDAGHGCQHVGPLTAWKRVYLEKHQMFRSGLLVVGTAAAGSNQVTVQIPAGLRWHDVALGHGDSIRLVHAPRLDGLDFSTDFHFEDAIVTAIDRVAGHRNQRRLTLAAPLGRSYTQDDSYDLLTALADGVSDGVGNLAAGTYGRNEDYLRTAFDPAYIDMQPVAHQSVTEMPYVPVVRRPDRLANKWFENSPVNLATLARAGNSNVKHVLAASGEPDPNNSTSANVSPFNFGATGIELTAPPAGFNQISRPNWSWSWVGGIERATSTNGNPYYHLDAWKFNGENLVHELAHSFNVNSIFYFGSDYGHCSHTMASNAALGCTMRSSQDPLFVAAQKTNGIIGFHYTSEDDSEYMAMRRLMEPLPTPIR